MTSTKFCFLFLLFFIPISCVALQYSIQDLEALRYFNAGRFSQAAQHLGNDLTEVHSLYNIDWSLKLANRGIIHHTAGNYEMSNKYLLELARLIEYQKPITISESAGSFITNEKAVFYRMEDFERALIHFYLAFNYLLLGKLNEALVEARRAENVFIDLGRQRNKEYQEFALSHYFSGLIHEINGEDNDAYIEYKKAHSLIGDVPLLISDLCRISSRLGLKDEEKKWKSKQSSKEDNQDIQTKDLAEMVVIVQVGLAPKKVPNPDFPFLPKYSDIKTDYHNIKIVVDEKEYKAYEMVNIGEILRKQLEDRLAIITTKLVARSAMKVGVVKYVGEKYGSLEGALAGVILFSQEEPDLRSWSTLPAYILISRIHLLAGKHMLKIHIYNQKGKIIKLESKEIDLKGRQKLFLNFRFI